MYIEDDLNTRDFFNSSSCRLKALLADLLVPSHPDHAQICFLSSLRFQTCRHPKMHAFSLISQDMPLVKKQVEDLPCDFEPSQFSET